jgi:rhodanese-related sulfurtransferase
MEAKADFILLDVRSPAEHGELSLPGDVLMPLGALRARLETLPRDKEIIAYCDIGLRSYEASLILRHGGFPEAKFLDGGLESWPWARSS